LFAFLTSKVKGWVLEFQHGGRDYQDLQIEVKHASPRTTVQALGTENWFRLKFSARQKHPKPQKLQNFDTFLDF
jgi:hypothetical protein